MKKYRRFIFDIMLLVLFCFISLAAAGCVSVMREQEEHNNLNFVVLDKEKVPEELKEEIDKSKEGEFRLTYVDQGKMYIARGYGPKEKSGYSVAVTGLYETEDTVCICTELIGPKKGEETKEAVTYPYVVVELDEIDKEVVFK